MANQNLKTLGDVRSDDDFFAQLKLLRPSCTELDTNLTISSASFFKSNGQVVRSYITNKPSGYTGSTINVAADAGVVAIPSGNFAKALVTIDGNDNVSITVGTPSSVSINAAIEPTSSNYPIALLLLHKTGSVLDNLLNVNIEDRRPLNQSHTTSSPTRAYEMMSEQYLAQIYDEFLFSPNTDDNSIDFTVTQLSQLQNGSSSNEFTLSYSTVSGTVAGGTSLVLSAAPTFTVYANCWVVSGSTYSRITTVADQQHYTLATALTNGAVTVTVLQPVVTKDLYQGVGSAANQTRVIDTFSQNVDSVIIDYDDSVGNNNFNFAGGTPNVIALGSTTNIDSYVTVSRPTSKDGFITDVTLTPAAPNLKIVFLPNKTSGSGTVNLIRYACLFIKDPDIYRGGIFNQAFGFTDNTGTPLNCSFSVVGGLTAINLNGTFASYVPGVNLGSPYGDIIVLDSGVEVPRFTSGITDPTLPFYTETASNQITLWGNFSTALTRRQISVVRRFGSTDSSDQNGIFIANLKFNGFNFATYVVGSASQVSLGLANYSSISAAIAALPASGGKIFVLSGTYTENPVITSSVVIEGLGRTSQIVGNISLNTGSDYSSLRDLRVLGNISITTTGNFLNELWLTSGHSVTDTGSSNDINYVIES